MSANPKLKPLTKKERERIEKAAEKNFDFEAFKKQGIFINLNPDTITYFKDLAKETGFKYQFLMRLALQHYVENELRPNVDWKKLKRRLNETRDAY